MSEGVRQRRSPAGKRLQRATFGGLGLLVLVFFAVGVVVAPEEPGMWRGLVLTVVPVVWILVRWGRYRRPAKVERWQDVVPALVRSREEYCLVLRAFGEDGRITLPDGAGMKAPHSSWFVPNTTLEQVVAKAVRRSLGFTTYAIVDQDLRKAPPGPVWLRAGAEWKTPVAALIARAHSIVLVLPPGQEVRDGLKWEVGQITRRGFQTRTTVLLPPPRHGRWVAEGYPEAFRSLCVVLATFESFIGEVDDVGPLDVEALRSRIAGTEPPSVMIAKMSRKGPFDDPELACWNAPKRKLVGDATYLEALHKQGVLWSTEAELSGFGFDARYPEPWPPVD
ncbi:hypothetical protein [Lentzea sp. NPDC059081]|uniref:hypothetical protein n=1 Tax=Lentzea sp. NPDC059081 TaxID=3346719 RepID=UPI00368CA910